MERFIAFKSRTKERVDKNDEMEQAIIEMTMKEALEEPAKEAMYALDSTNPLRLYDCLVPEITTYRPLRILTDELYDKNYIAKLMLKETELKIVSVLIEFIFHFIRISAFTILKDMISNLPVFDT